MISLKNYLLNPDKVYYDENARRLLFYDNDDKLNYDKGVVRLRADGYDDWANETEEKFRQEAETESIEKKYSPQSTHKLLLLQNFPQN
ncbi:MAG: hypothetical protein LBF32_01815 [Streptococcaceae bacterium]|jgi:hypothetical protein|nr:hypothetical protein [Streptococcaceae bacterium]